MASKIEIELTLSDALAERDERPDDTALDMLASVFLIPREYEYVRAKGCLNCGGNDLEKLMQKALTFDGHPDLSAWPYSSPCGDSLLYQCNGCGGESEFVFWFRKDPS